MEPGVFQGPGESLRPAPRVTIAVPLFNEESVIPELLKRTTAVLGKLENGPHEIVLVDDGSSDATPQMLVEAALNDDRIVAVHLSRNFGQQAAYGAALEIASGDVVVLMDGDLQDSPEAVPQFIEAYRKGNDVVYAERAKRKESRIKRTCYAIFYYLIAKLSDVGLPRDAGDFGLLSRRVVDVLKRLPERHRYWRGLRCWVGFKQTCVVVEREARHSGIPKYSVRKLLKLAADGIFSFSLVPLRAATLVGATAVTLSLLFAVYSLFVFFVLRRSPQGFTALLLGGTFLAGVQLLFLGVIGEYIGRIYEQVKQRPHFIISQVTRQPCSPITPKPTATSTTIIGGGEPEKSLSSNKSTNGIRVEMDMFSTLDAAMDYSFPD